MGEICAVDGVCYLANEILPLVHFTTATPARPTTEELCQAFDRYEAKQRSRAEFCVTMSGYSMRLERMETWWLRLLLYIIPWIPTKAKADFFPDFDQCSSFGFSASARAKEGTGKVYRLASHLDSAFLELQAVM